MLSLAVGVGVARADEARIFDIDAPAGPLLGCLEQLSQRSGVRIVDASRRVADSRCGETRERLSLQAALQRWLTPLSLGWKRLDDGTIQIVDATRQRMDLAALTIQDAATPQVAQLLEPGAVLAPTPLAESATAVTRIQGDWLQRAPQMDLSRIGRYAPNMYGSGQGLAIRGIERDIARDTDYFNSLTVSLDGIDLGTRLLDDDVVLLDDLQRIDLVRGARSFEAGSASAAGEVRLLSPAPAAETEFQVGGGWGTEGAAQAHARWSGPLTDGGLSGSAVLAYRRLPDSVRYRYVPEAGDNERKTTNARVRLDYSPDGVPGLQAGLSALVVDADSNDRLVLPDSSVQHGQEFPRDVFDRVSFARAVGWMRTRGQGLAAFARYESSDDTLLELHANDTNIHRDVRSLPRDGRGQRTNEERNRVGVRVQRKFTNTTAAAGLERTSFTSDLAEDWKPYVSSPLTRSTTRLHLETHSAWVWLVQQWSSSWHPGLGLRWLRDSMAEVNNAPVFDISSHENLLLPLATVQWQPIDGHALVLSRTSGYRSGGSQPTLDLRGYEQYPAERERSTELAWNAQWAASTSSNFTLFHGMVTQRYTLNLTHDAPGVAQIDGAELEVVHTFSPRWRARVGLGVLEARNRRGAGGEYDRRLAGHRTGSAPPRTQFVGVRYGEKQGWFAALDAFHAAAAQSGPINHRNQRRPAYTLLDGSLGYAADGWQATLVASNLTDAEYAERYVASSRVLPAGWRLGEPRRVELRLDFRW